MRSFLFFNKHGSDRRGVRSIKTYSEDLTAVTEELECRILAGEELPWEDVQYALEHVEGETDGGMSGLACYFAARYMLDQGRQEECLCYLNESIRCLIGTGQERNLAQCYNMLGEVFHSQNNLIPAMEQYQKALMYARQYDRQLSYCLILGNMADVYQRVNSYESAVNCYRECIRKLKENAAGFPKGGNRYCKVLAKYGYCLTMADKAEEAISVAEETGLLLKEKEESAAVKLAVYTFFALLCHRMGELAAAQDYMNQAMQEAVQGGSISSDFDNIQNLIEYLILVERFDCLQKMLNYLEPQAAIERNEGLLLQLSLFRLQYCSADMDREHFLESTHIFFRLKDKHEQAENSQILQMMDLRGRLREIEEEQSLLMKENTKLLYQTEHDDLSGLYNRRSMNRYMEEMFEEAMRRELPLGVLFVDIDYFKQLNDRYGHQKGDACIVAVSETVRTCMPEDFAARYGGDEFVIITIARSREYLEEHAQMLVENIQAGKIPNEDSKYMNIMTVTIGAVWAVPHKPNKMWDFLSAADEALYRQKQEQRGCVCFYAGQGDSL